MLFNCIITKSLFSFSISNTGGGPEPALTVSGANEIFQVFVSDTMAD